MDPSTLQTPAALVDEAKMLHNIERMQSHIASLGATLRPHVKTPKCLEIARLQRDAGAVGITVSTLKEAEQFFAGGFEDILYAVCLAPNKIERANALVAKGCRLRVIVDSLAAAQAVIANGRGLEVLIEVDTDGHRSGVAPDSNLLLALGRELHGAGILAGVLTHAGESYEENTPEGLARIAEQERSRCVRAAERLREPGASCPVVSVGSTPTAYGAKSLEGVTEVRAGVYVFQDLVMCNIGVCTMEDVALSVLATVIGHQPEKGWVITDAGWMAMSRDRGTANQKIDYAYGAVCDLQGAPIPGWTMVGANQEHGILASSDRGERVTTRFPLGSMVRILPNHACATAAPFDSLHIVRNGRVAATWDRFSGW